MCSHILQTYTKLTNHGPQLYDHVFVLQLAAQVLDEFDDEDIGVGLLDAKLDKVVAKKLGKNSTEKKNTAADAIIFVFIFICHCTK